MFHEDFLRSIDVNIATLEPLHSGIAIFNDQARLVFANTAYKKMYHLDDSCLGLDATAFFITARQGILEVLKTGKANSCASVTVNGLYGVTYRWPLFDRQGRIAGCMTENISVSPRKNKIHEMQHILGELEAYDGYSTLICPQQSTEPVTFDTIVGESSAMRMLKEKGRRFAQHDEPILILGENGTDLPTDEQLAAAKTKADDLLDQWKNGDATADSFGELAKTNSADETNKDNGGLNEDANRSSLDANLTDWLFAEGRQPGDAAVVEASDSSGNVIGYQILYVESLGEIQWKYQATTALRSDDYDKWYTEVEANYPAELTDLGKEIAASSSNQ